MILDQMIRLEEGAPVDTEFPGRTGNVIIFPGGGYEWLSPREGQPVASAFAAAGFRPWILSYSVSDGKPLGTRPLLEAAAAVLTVREQFSGVPVYVCGFSAGAHVAASLGVHWNDEAFFPGAQKQRVRPDGMILCYPVITSGKYAHKGSLDHLVGDDESFRAYFSLERFVNPDTPPVFLWHTAADASVPVQNSLLFAQALAENHVSFELHIYPDGVHGLSLATAEVEDPAKNRFPDAHVAEWFADCICWLKLQKKNEK